jgi:hypothetical protein
MLARAPRDRQRGNSLLLAMIVMSALATLGSLTVVSVQGSLKASTNDRSQAIAMYAAESGAAVAMEFLRRKYDPGTFWSALVYIENKDNNSIILPPISSAIDGIPSNGAQPGEPENLFSADLNAWYSVTLLNNVDDPAFRAADPATVTLACPAGTCPCPGRDCDAQVIIQSTGHGPQGSLAVIEVEVRRFAANPWILDPPPAPPRPSPFAAPVGPPPIAVPADRGLIVVGWRVAL